MRSIWMPLPTIKGPEGMPFRVLIPYIFLMQTLRFNELKG